MPKILKVLIGVTASVGAFGCLVWFAIDSSQGAERGKLKTGAEARQAFVRMMSDGAFPKGERGMEVSTGDEADTTLQFKMTFGNDDGALEHFDEIMKTQNETFADMARVMMEDASRRGLCELGFTALSYEGSLSITPQIFDLQCGVSE